MTKKNLCALSACLLAISIATPIFANDSSAELATGGLELTKSNDIEMQSEDLFISMKEIRVQYHFYNHSNRDVTTQIAFPMPDIPYGVDDFNFAIPTDDPQNILGFTTTVNDHPVVARVEQKALLGGTDRTDVLRRLGVPIAPGPSQKADYLSQQTWNELIHLGLIQDAPKGDLQPRWTLKTTYYWQQTFPAHQEVVINHRYLPSVGETVPMPSVNLMDVLHSQYYSQYCADTPFLTAVSKPSNAMWEQHYLKYILVTGANWSGPIKNFRLVVDKGSPDNLISFCGQGVHKIGPTQFEIRASNFIPTSNLSVLILSPTQPEPADVPSAPVNSEWPPPVSPPTEKFTPSGPVDPKFVQTFTMPNHDERRLDVRAGNIFIQEFGQTRQLTDLGQDSDPILSPDRKFVVFTRTNFGSPIDDDDFVCRSGFAADQLRRINLDGTDDRVLFVGHKGEAPQEQVCMFQQKQFTSDGRLLFFLSPAWVTSSALHVFDFKSHQVKYVAPANNAIVLNFCKGEHQDQLILQQHRYFIGSGSYDWFWLYDRAGNEEIGSFADENASRSSIVESAQMLLCEH